MSGSEPMRRVAAILCCLTLVCGCSAKKEGQGASETPAPKEIQASKETQTAEERPAPEENWPRQISQGGNRLTYYQPQIDSWTDYRELDGRVAVVLTPAGGESVTGMIIFPSPDGHGHGGPDCRHPRYPHNDADFPSLDEAAQQKMRSVSQDLLPKEPVPISLDRMLAAAEDQARSGKIPRLSNPAALKSS